MATTSQYLSFLRPDKYVCARCAFRASKIASKTARRWYGPKYTAKLDKAAAEWSEKATEINDGRKKSMLTILEERGLVHQIAGTRENLDALLTEKRVGAYVGIDPTASSLHVGHLLPLMSIFWMYLHGFHAVSLLGGATAKIGDPTGRLQTRMKEEKVVRTANMVNIHYQLKRLWKNVEVHGKKFGYHWDWAWHRELVNNNEWMNKLSIMEFLQILGPGVRLGPMLARDTVKNKMDKGDGMSFAEFSYPLLQAWDWWHMYHTKGIQMQIGGSDQYGNITAGIDVVKYIGSHHPDPDVRAGKDVKTAEPCGFTVPLLTTTSGEKFGKSAGNAIWLDSEKTSPFDLYGFFIRQSDADVSRYLKLFTFIPIEDIDTIVEAHTKEPSKRTAQHRLAREFVELIHGPETAQNAEQQHRLLFNKPSAISTLESPAASTPQTFQHIDLNNAPQPNIKLPNSLIHMQSVAKILYAAGLAASIQDGHRITAAGSVYISGKPSSLEPMADGAMHFTPIKSWKIEDTAKFLIDGKLLILRRGKHNVRIVEVVSDEEWERMGTKYPGQPLHAPPPETRSNVSDADGPNMERKFTSTNSAERHGEDERPKSKTSKAFPNAALRDRRPESAGPLENGLRGGWGQRSSF